LKSSSKPGKSLSCTHCWNKK